MFRIFAEHFFILNGEHLTTKRNPSAPLQ